MLTIPQKIQDHLDAGALLAISHSGGKDSQAMFALLRDLVPAEQIAVVHADLAEVEWAGTEAHARATTAGYRFETEKAIWSDGSAKTFLDLVEARGMFPTPGVRQCTSDLKRTPIEKVIRRLCKETGRNLVVSAQGLRAEESSDRAAKATVEQDERLSKAGRDVLTWLPIHELTTDEVFQVIAEAGQVPHPAYGLGMTRLSCCFCIMASRADLTLAAEHNPDLYAKVVEVERRLGHTLSPSRKPLEEITGIAAEHSLVTNARGAVDPEPCPEVDLAA